MAAAHIALYGMDPMEFLDTKDSFRRGLMQLIANKAHELDRKRNQELANLIAYEVGKMLNTAFGRK
jgi:hypothetical protein